MIGTNNAGHRKEKSEETALGIKTILAELEQRLPETKVLLLAIFPRGATADHELRKLNAKTNSIIKTYADNKRVFWLDLNDKFLEPDGTLPKSIMPDLLHPNAKGYEIWAEAMEPSIAKLMGEPTFSRPTIDFGIVVSDVEKSLKWYKEVVGFKASGDFTVQPNVANDAGLTKTDKPIKIYKLTLGSGAGATNVKLMQIPDASRKAGGTEYIHSQLGMSYMTIFVTDTTSAVARAEKLGSKPLAKGPVDLGGGKMFLTLLKDPDGNFVELVGPKAK
jgi:predicted enzyme related to lactoylglutathione lyase